MGKGIRNPPRRGQGRGEGIIHGGTGQGGNFSLHGGKWAGELGTPICGDQHGVGAPSMEGGQGMLHEGTGQGDRDPP